MAEAEADLLYREWSDCASVSTGCPKEGTRGSAGALQEGGRGGRRGRKGGDLMRQMAMEAGRCRPRVGCGLCRRRAEEGAPSIEHCLPPLWGRAGEEGDSSGRRRRRRGRRSRKSCSWVLLQPWEEPPRGRRGVAQCSWWPSFSVYCQRADGHRLATRETTETTPSGGGVGQGNQTLCVQLSIFSNFIL